MALNLIQLYLNVLTGQLVSVNGSPTSIPPLYYGDTPTFFVYPVMPTPGGNPLQSFSSYSMAGYSMNLTMAGPPNAQNPPTPFASLDGLTWVLASSGYSYFTGTVDLTQIATGNFIGNGPGKQAYFNLDVFDGSLKRTTLLQVQFTINASIDTVAAQPGGNPVQYLTQAQSDNKYVQIGAVPGKFIEWEDSVTGQKYVQNVQNGVLTLTPIS